MRIPTPNRRARRGAVLLEMAIVAPILVLLLFGTIDLALAAFTNNTLAEAAREGTRYAIVHGSLSSQPLGPTSNNAALETVVLGFAPVMTSAKVTVASTWIDGDNKPGSRVTVRTSTTYTPIGLVGSNPISISASSTMTIIY